MKSKILKNGFQKKGIALMLTTTLFLSAMSPMTSFAKDIDEHWASSVMEKWQNEGWLKGDDNGNLKPDSYTTRAELVAFIARAFELPSAENKEFKDVDKSVWYHDDLQKCVAAGIISGYPDDTFKPTNIITRAEMSRVIFSLSDLSEEPSAVSDFKDADILPQWAKGYIGAVYKAGLMVGFADNSFGAEKQLKRAEAVSSLDRSKEFMNSTSTTSNEKVTEKSTEKTTTDEKTETTTKKTTNTSSSGGGGGSSSGGGGGSSNPGGQFTQPKIAAKSKAILTGDGYQFKDSNGNGAIDKYEDWRYSSEERAKDLVNKMNVDEKIGLMVINSRPMGIDQKDPNKTSYNGILDEEEKEAQDGVFGSLPTYGTTRSIDVLNIRHFILRANKKPSEIATWINTMNEVAEKTRLGIPVIVASNSRNENAEAAFGFQEASGVFSTWPGTLGIAAAAKGINNSNLISEFASIARSEWDATGIKKGYMYMADTSTDPRWYRIYGTFGEDPGFISDAMSRIVKGFQGNKLTNTSIALTVKHFPGGGARENGYDPHYEKGKWNVYKTPNSLENYHLGPFQAAVSAGVSSIMPYYAIPSNDKSSSQNVMGGSFEEVGFAFNKAIINDLLREKLGHQGYINSDSGILYGMAWGVSDLTVPQRAAKAINAGTDIISDTNDVWSIKKAYDQGLITEERIDLSAKRLLKEIFDLGLFENPYRDPQNADKVVATQANWDKAYEAHQKSVVLLKNENSTLPLTNEKLEGKKVYVEHFTRLGGDEKTKILRESMKKNDPNIQFVENYKDADYSILFVDPVAGAYFEPTDDFLPLNICPSTDLEDITKDKGTGINVDKIKEIRSAMYANNGKVIMNINFKMPWLVQNVEYMADAMLGGFDTFSSATVDVIRNRYSPTGVMPLTLPKNDDVIAVDSNGVCISPNDVPGYDKDKYMPEGMTYAYKDSVGNVYKLNFGLRYPDSDKKYEQPIISARVKGIVNIDGYQFKDSNGNEKLDQYEDWRLTPQERAKDLVSQMNIDEKIGQMVINSRTLGIDQKDPNKTSHNGILDEEEGEGFNGFGQPVINIGTSDMINNMKIRHFILRANKKPSELATWINTMNEVAEKDNLGIPVIVTSNSRNENAEAAFGFQEASGTFSTYPGTLGIAAAALGADDMDLISEFAENARKEWDATGIKKGYMYMADTSTDPRWYRIYGTFGEDPNFIADAITRIIKGFQGETLTNTSIALTTKHFPGGGARENGFDPHYDAGKWNVYKTPDSLENYHLGPFQAAVNAGTSSIMPYYAIPSNDKSGNQSVVGGKFDEEVGFAFNKQIITDILRDQLGHKGYINSDSGILDGMAWGVQNLSKPERAAKAINAGTDIISDTNEVSVIKEAYEKGLITEDRINLSAERLLTEAFQLGLFENPYRDPQNADKVVEKVKALGKDYEAHQKSVVLLKNKDNVLPLTNEKLEGKKVFAKFYARNNEQQKTGDLRSSIMMNDSTVTLVDDYNEADYVVLFIDPSAGTYFQATEDYLQLNICPSTNADPTKDNGTGINVDEIKLIRQAMDAKNGKIIMNVNFKMPWLLKNIEPMADGLLGGFDTFTTATMDIIRGQYSPTGVMPLTLPGSDEVIAIDANGICASPNDVPGYDKDKYMTNGLKYAYVDELGSEYKLGFGLNYTSSNYVLKALNEISETSTIEQTTETTTSDEITTIEQTTEIATSDEATTIEQTTETAASDESTTIEEATETATSDEITTIEQTTMISEDITEDTTTSSNDSNDNNTEESQTPSNNKIDDSQISNKTA